MGATRVLGLGASAVVLLAVLGPAPAALAGDSVAMNRLAADTATKAERRLAAGQSRSIDPGSGQDRAVMSGTRAKRSGTFSRPLRSTNDRVARSFVQGPVQRAVATFPGTRATPSGARPTPARRGAFKATVRSSL
jgi:hypothetical protein